MTESEWDGLISDLKNALKEVNYGCGSPGCLPRAFLTLITGCMCSPIGCCTNGWMINRHTVDNITVMTEFEKQFNSRYTEKGLKMSFSYSFNGGTFGSNLGICCDCSGQLEGVLDTEEGPRVICLNKFDISIQRVYQNLSYTQQYGVSNPDDFARSPSGMLPPPVQSQIERHGLNPAPEVATSKVRISSVEDFFERFFKEDYKELYMERLLEEGFDSIETLLAVEERDLDFMKKGHRRVFLNALKNVSE
jgi:hypothetical protein